MIKSGKKQAIQAIKKGATIQQKPAQPVKQAAPKTVEPAPYIPPTKPAAPQAAPQSAPQTNADGSVMVAYDDVVKLLKSIVKIKIGMLNATGPDKVEVLRFETNKKYYTDAVNDVKETLKDLTERALEGYIAPTTKITTDFYVDAENKRERFFIVAITTDKMKKSFVSVFINGRDNVTQDTLLAINNRLNPHDMIPVGTNEVQPIETPGYTLSNEEGTASPFSVRFID